MKFENLDTGGEGDLFYAHVRSGQLILRIMSGIAAVLWALAAYHWIVDTDQDPVEWVIIATMLSASAIVSFPLVRFLGYGTVRVSVTSAFITLDHESLKFGWDAQIPVVAGVEPQIETKTRKMGSGSNQKTVKRYSVAYDGERLIGSLDSRRHAVAFAKRVNQALALATATGDHAEWEPEAPEHA